MSDKRQIYIQTRLGFKNVAQDAKEGAQTIAREIDRATGNISQSFDKVWKGIKDDRGAFAALKAQVDKFVADLTTSGGKIKIPAEEVAKAAKATGDSLSRIAEQNAAALQKLYPQLDALKTKMQQAASAGNFEARRQSADQLNNLRQTITAREQLARKVAEQYDALTKLVGVDVLEGNATASVTQGQQSLSQQLAETKRRMEELALAGKRDSEEYQDLSAKARELAEAMKQLNQDTAPEKQMRMRTAIMNLKNEMAKLKQEGKENTAQYRQLQQEAIRLTQSMNAANKQIKNMANPNAVFQGAISGLQGLSGAFSAATGVMALYGEKNEDVQKIMMKLQAVMSITMGLQSISTTLNKNSAFQLNIVGRLTNWWAQCKAKAAAATVAETAATATNTAAIGVQTAAVNAGTAANVAHAFSWKAVGVAIKSVPVFGWILAIISAITTAVIALTNNLNKLTAKQQAMKEVMAQARVEIMKETNQLKFLYKAATDTNQSMDVRLAAIKQLKSLYPAYFKDLKDEAILAGKTADAYNKAAEAIRRKAIASALQKQIQKYSEKISEWYDDDDNYKRAEHINKTRAQYIKDKQIMTPEYIATLDTEVVAYQGRRYKDKDARDRANRIVAHETERAAYQKKFKEDNKESLEKIEYLTKTLYQYADEVIPQETETAVEKATKEAKEAKTKDYTTAIGNANVADQKAEDKEVNAVRDRNKAILQLDQELEQRRIDLLEEGVEKRQRQRMLDQQKERDSLEAAMQQELAAEVERQKKIWEAQEEANAKAAAARGKQYAKRPFSSGDILTADILPGDTIGGKPGDLTINTGQADTRQINLILSKYGLMHTLLLNQQAKRISEENKAERQAMDEYLRQYGTMKEKREAIDRIYAEKKADAASQGEAMQIQQEWNAALAQIDFDDFVKNRAALAFGEIDHLSQSTIAELIAEMEKYRGKAVETFDPEKIEKFEQALAKLKKAQATNADNPLSAIIPEYIRERAAAQAELDEKKRMHNDLLAKKAEKTAEVEAKTRALISAMKELADTEITEADAKDGVTVPGVIADLYGLSEQSANSGETEEATRLRNLAIALEVLNNDLADAQVQLGGVTQSSDEATSQWKNLADAFKEKFTGKNNALGSLTSATEIFSETMQGVSLAVGNLKGAAEALGADTSAGSAWDKIETLTNALLGFSDGIANLVQSAMSGSISGILGGITGIFTGWVTAFAALHDKSRERTINQLQDHIDELDRLNDRLDRRLEKQYSRQASASYDQMAENTRQQIVLIRQQMDAERDKKNMDDERLQDWEDKIEELQNQVEDYKEAAIDAIIGEDIASSIGNFADALADAWGSTRQSAEATKDFVKDMLRQMVIEAMKTDLTEPIQRLRDMMTSAMADDKVTAAEQEAMQDFAAQVAEDTRRKYEWASDILGISDSSQSGGDTGGYATASQDSIDELNGRFSALQTSAELSRLTLDTIKLDTASIRESIAAQSQAAQEAKDLQVTAVGHLEAISRNTRQLYEMNERLGKIEKNTQSL